MILRRTLAVLFLAVLLGVGLWDWAIRQRDPCDTNGDRSDTATQTVEQGGRLVEVSCRFWIPGQPMGVQLLCLMELVTMVTLAISVVDDIRSRSEIGRLERRR